MRLAPLLVTVVLAPLLVVAVLAGCGTEDERRPPAGEPAAATPATAGSPQIAPPDAGMPAGHAGDGATVAVPESDRTPPESVVRLEPGLAEATSGGAAPPPVRLPGPVLRATGVARDADGGTARVRVSVQARVRCDGTTVPLVRHFPAPASERMLIAPGTPVPAERTRRVRLDLAAGRCPRTALDSVEGELWADATSARELESSSPPIRVSYRPGR